jgi:hypothetical protein
MAHAELHSSPLAFDEQDVPETHSYVRFARTHHAMKEPLRNYVGMLAMVLFVKHYSHGNEALVEFHPPGFAQPQHYWLNVKHFDRWLGAAPQSEVA